MEVSVESTIEYYTVQSKKILDEINTRSDFSVEEIIEKGEQLSVLEYKLTALEAAREDLA